MASTCTVLRRRRRPTNRRLHRPYLFATLLALATVAGSQDAAEEIDYGNHNLEWEDGPTSWEEFGHANAPDVCGLPVLTVEEWEAGKYWEGNKPVLVKNMTDGWAALTNWKK